MNHLRTCVTPEGTFRYGIHKPSYTVANLRQNSRIQVLGSDEKGEPVDNAANFPPDEVVVHGADWIFEIANPLPFKGTTYIDKEWADASAGNPGRIRIASPPEVSLNQTLAAAGIDPGLIEQLPEPLLLALATTSTDPADLIRLAEISCDIVKDAAGSANGLRYTRESGRSPRPVIHNHLLFEAVANNPHLPDSYKIVMVIRPGAQGGSEIVGEWPKDEQSHVYEYLRRNSYIAGGHYAANMAEDAVRYSIEQLSMQDMRALRHLYYQRTYARLAAELELPVADQKRVWTSTEIEALRLTIADAVNTTKCLGHATLWGWNFGFDYAPSRYRLHASHQQIHQQYAMIPETVEAYSGDPNRAIGILPAFGCGDMIAEVIEQYRALHQRDFFDDYCRAIAGNRRMDGRDDLEKSLVVWSDDNAMLFIPKAQTSQWEMQLMTKRNDRGEIVGNILEADTGVRESLDTGIYMAQKTLAALGAKMVTSIEYPKRLGRKSRVGQPLLYAFLPRLPESPGAFSEAQLRFINGHYPEDFAAVCRRNLP